MPTQVILETNEWVFEHILEICNPSLKEVQNRNQGSHILMSMLPKKKDMWINLRFLDYYPGENNIGCAGDLI